MGGDLILQHAFFRREAASNRLIKLTASDFFRCRFLLYRVRCEH
ncbi:hypothetical protein PAMC26577_27865 [Caballeronia sordidicola]|uniref:Uncharacterized protein n=1 Tax=Caballeronia sordidicola TaxID=196367 RepID=A0A242MFQ6_CABSO|nr:hypothetical protein PAMC26577_27865 [Caballeronia sordidicola]